MVQQLVKYGLTQPHMPLAEPEPLINVIYTEQKQLADYKVTK